MQRGNKIADVALIVFLYLIATAIAYVVFLKIKILIHQYQ
jgi:hypothetical protein